MTLTAASLAVYVQGDAANDNPFLTTCAAEATAMVTQRIGTAEVPASILDRAGLEVAADLYYRRRTRNGVAEFDGMDMAPVRISRDPMAAAAAILAPYLGGGFA